MNAPFGKSARALLRIFAPAVALMGRTRFWLKFALVGLGIVVPLAVVVTSYLHVQDSNTDFASKEEVGLAYLKPAVNLLAAATAERTAAVELVSGLPNSTARSKAAMQTAIGAMNRAEASAGKLGLSGSWATLRLQIGELSSSRPATPAVAMSTYDTLIGGVQALIGADGNNSKMILDPASDSYYLMDAMLNRLTSVLDLAEEVGDLQATVHAGAALTLPQRLALEDLKQNLVDAKAADDSDYAEAFRNTDDPTVEPTVAPDLVRLDAKLSTLLAGMTAAVNGRLDVGRIQSTGLAVKGSVLALEAQTMPVTRRLLEARIGGYDANSRRTELITLLGLLLALWLGIGFYLYMRRSVSGILNATAAVAERGDLSTEVNADGRDELSDVNRAFGEVMNYLRDTAEAADRIAEGDLGVEVTVKSPEDQLSTAFSKMVASLRARRRRDEAEMAHLATHDPLTGLLNRRAFEETFEFAIAEGKPGALILLDLDNFKYVNETYAHKTGDALVAELALALTARLDERHVLARLGGDEFCVLAAMTTLQEAAIIANELLDTVRTHVMSVGGVPLRASASIGVTAFHGKGAAPEFLADADRAMYASKESGRDRVTVFSDVDRAEARRSMQSAGEHMIRSALAEDRFELYVQPIVSFASGMMSHCEVLVRMRSPEGELVPPGTFLPAAERLGLIRSIDYWVIEHAFAEAARYSDLTFELNLSGGTIDDAGLESFISAQITSHAVDPSRIVFELTETAAVSNLARARELAHSLSDIGCEFAIDDFGAGFSTFYYLKHFPAKYVKIDGEFMNDPQSRMDELVIESIVRIGREVGKLTIAEYVADRAAMERARALGVDYGQGYFFAKPFPIGHLSSMPRQFLDLSSGVVEASVTEAIPGQA